MKIGSVALIPCHTIYLLSVDPDRITKSICIWKESHFFGNQEVKPTQKCTTIMWPSTMFEVSTQSELLNIIKYNKIEACVRTLESTY